MLGRLEEQFGWEQVSQEGGLVVVANAEMGKEIRTWPASSLGTNATVGCLRECECKKSKNS